MTFEMNGCERLIRQYKDKVLNIGKLSPVELYKAWLKKDFAEQADVDTFYDPYIKRPAIIEILSSDKFEELNLSEDDMDFLLFTVKDEGEGREYHKLLRDRGYEYKDVYALIETTTEHISTNCTKLTLDMLISRGIDKKDYDEENMVLVEYLSRIEALEQGWY